jgi:hypothetical protein
MNRHQRRSRKYFEEAIDPTDSGAGSTPAPEDTAAAPAPAEEGAGAPPAPLDDEKDDDTKAIEGFLKGVEDVSPHLKSEDKTGSEEAAKTAAAPVAAKPDDKAAAAPATAPAPDAALDAEVKTLGLKGAAEKRFREMSDEIKTARPFVEALGKVSVKTAADLENVLQASARGLAWEEAIEKTTATEEQMSSAFTVIRAMNSGDPNLMNAAYDALVEQVNALGKQLGRETAGYDPLSEHPDLAQEVENLELTRARALEIVKQRAADKQAGVQAANRQAQTERAAADEKAYQQAHTDATADMNAFEKEMRETDPQAAAKMPILIDMVQKGLVKDLHPSKWMAKVAMEYSKIRVAAAPAPAPVRRTPAPGAQPMRGGQQPTAVMDDKNDDGINPFLRGVAAASPGQ